MNRQKMLLFILVIILIVTAVAAYFRMPRQKHVEKLKYTPGAVASVATKDTMKQDEKKVHFDLLENLPPRFSGFKRNIFWLASLEPKKNLPPLPPPTLPVPPPPPPPPPPPTPLDLAKREIAKFTFLGFYKRKGDTRIFLSKDNKIFVVKKGDKIEDKFLVANISDEALIINTVAGGDQIVIPLIENKPLITLKK